MTVRLVAAGVIVILVSLVTVPAGAQLGNPGWGEDVVEVRESEGEVVLTLSFGGTGNVRYTTMDGSCTPDGCEPQARGPEDYTAVSGEVFFAAPGSRTITIPIVDDDLAEGAYEAFTVHAVEEPNPDPWPYAGDDVTVRIIDDDATDGRSSAAVPTRTPTTVPGDRSSRSAVEPPQQATGTTADDRATTKVALATKELRRGPGFELTSAGALAPTPGREAGGGESAVWFVLGLTAAVVSVGALALVRRQRRWSPTRP